MSGPRDGSGQEEYGRASYAIAGSDKVVEGLWVTYFGNRTVVIDPGSGVVGGIGFWNTTPAYFTSDLEQSANPRIDRLVARRTWPSLLVELAIIKGAPAASPVLPPLTQNFGGVWEYGLGYWRIPGNSGGNVVDGLVARHGSEFGETFTYDAANGTPPPTVGPGGSVFLKATNLRVPSAVKVSAEAWVDIECPVGQAAGGTVLIQCNNESWATPWKSVNGGSKQVYASLPRTLVPFGGPLAANLSVTAESLSQPITVSRFTTRMRQWT